MEAFFQTFGLVFFGEFGDKTQLLALILAARFKQPKIILIAILFATLLNHALAAWLGSLVSGYVTPEQLKWGVASAFFIFAIWVLFPDKYENRTFDSGRGAFLTTFIVFFIAEIGDKTQLATLALATHFQNVLLVTMASSLGLLAANMIAVYIGSQYFNKIPLQVVRWFSAVLFLLSGLATLLLT